jgi:tRNA dimethylallyltransferase
VARFCADASTAIAGIEARGRLPLLVGGTGLYLRRLETGIADMPPVPEAVRTALTAEWRAQGSAALHASLATVDPASAARIHPNDPQRIIRALSIWRVSGRAMSSFLQAQTAPTARRFHKWVLAPPDRTGLRQGLAARFEQMLERGLVNEVMALRARPGMSLDCPAMRAVGYREVWAYLDGELSRAQMRERAIISTGQYAKRQYTWFRAEPEAIWLDAAHEETRTQLIQALLESAQSGA